MDEKIHYANPKIQYDDFSQFEKVMNVATNLPKNSTRPVIIINSYIKHYPCMQLTELFLPASKTESVILLEEFHGKFPRMLCKFCDVLEEPNKLLIAAGWAEDEAIELRHGDEDHNGRPPEWTKPERTQFEEALVRILKGCLRFSDNIIIRHKFKRGSIDRIKHLPEILPLSYETKDPDCYAMPFNYCKTDKIILYRCHLETDDCFDDSRNNLENLISHNVGYHFSCYLEFFLPSATSNGPSPESLSNDAHKREIRSKLMRFLYNWLIDGRRIPLKKEQYAYPRHKLIKFAYICINFIEIILCGIGCQTNFHDFLMRGLYDPRLLCLIFAFAA